MIREAKLRDLPQLQYLVRAMNTEYYDVPLNGYKTAKTLYRMVKEGVVYVSVSDKHKLYEGTVYYADAAVSDKHELYDGAVYEHEVEESLTGFIGGWIIPDGFRDQAYLVEQGWYCTDNQGVLLLNAFQKAGEDNGVDEVRMCTLETSPRIAERILTRKGYKPAEQYWALRL